MATRIESSRNLVSLQSIAFIRPIVLTLSLTDARPNTAVNVFFDSDNVNHLVNSGTIAYTNSVGSATLSLSIPGGVYTTGTKTIIVTDAASLADISIVGSMSGSATATFSSTGITQLYQTTVTTTTTNTVEIINVLPAVQATRDPLAQSFFTYGMKDGMFLTSIELFFSTIDATVPVRVELRKMINGFPDQLDTTNPNLVVSKMLTSANVSSNASVGTKFTFNTPVYLEEDKDYCFVVFSNSDKFQLFTSKLGERSIENSRLIYEQPYIGSMFKSENNITWNAEQTEDIKFTLNRALFNTSASSEIKLNVNSEYFVLLGHDSFYTTNGSYEVKVIQKHKHGLDVGSKSNIIGNTSGVYNGISSNNFCGLRTVESVIDDYTYTYNTGSLVTATKDGFVTSSGTVSEIQVDNGGTGYISAPLVTFSPAGATATAHVTNGTITHITVDLGGNSYSTAPTISFTGVGTGAVATAIVDAVFQVRNNKVVNLVTSGIPAYTIRNTSIDAFLSTTQWNYEGGTLSNYQPASTSTKFNHLGQTLMLSNSVIASTDNETTKMSGNKSLTISYSLSSSNSNVSPFIDLSNSPRLLSYTAKINNQTGDTIEATTSSGTVDSITLLNFGSGYTVAPVVSITPSSGISALATAVLGTSSVSTATIGVNGAGYNSVPLISFSGGLGSGGVAATGVAVLQPTSVASVALTAGGSGYTSLPTVAISGVGGSGAAIPVAVLTPTSIASITPAAGGSGYTVAPTVVFSGGGGTGAAATANLTTGAITSYTITNAGSGYTSAPTISFTGGTGGTGAVPGTVNITPTSVASVSVTSGTGSGYVTVPNVVFSGGGGSGAAATASLTARGVASITVLTGGSGYVSAPTVVFDNTGTGFTTTATATSAIFGKSIASITIDNVGTNYTSIPDVTIIRNPIDVSGGVDAIGIVNITSLNTELSPTKGKAASRYLTKPTVLSTISTGAVLYSELYSMEGSSVDYYIRTSLSGSTTNHLDLEWKLLTCDTTRNKSTKFAQYLDYKFYTFDLPPFDTYDLKCVFRAIDPTKFPIVNNYRLIVTA